MLYLFYFSLSYVKSTDVRFWWKLTGKSILISLNKNVAFKNLFIDAYTTTKPQWCYEFHYYMSSIFVKKLWKHICSEIFQHFPLGGAIDFVCFFFFKPSKDIFSWESRNVIFFFFFLSRYKFIWVSWRNISRMYLLTLVKQEVLRFGIPEITKETVKYDNVGHP